MTTERRESKPSMVSIESGSWGVKARARNEIPQQPLITTVLNVALMEKFNLGIQFATEGGMLGMHKDAHIDLTNLSDGRTIGLWNETFFPDHPYTQREGLTEVLDYYEHLLHLLLDENFSAEGRDHNSGELLEIPQGEATTERVWSILKDILIATEDRVFAETVITKIVNHDSSRVFIRGLTDEEVMERFVDPPLE